MVLGCGPHCRDGRLLSDLPPLTITSGLSNILTCELGKRGLSDFRVDYYH